MYSENWSLKIRVVVGGNNTLILFYQNSFCEIAYFKVPRLFLKFFRPKNRLMKTDITSIKIEREVQHFFFFF